MQVLYKPHINVKEEEFSIKGIKNETLLNFVHDHTQESTASNQIILAVDNKFSIDNLPNPDHSRANYSSIVNLRKLNDIREITNFFCAVNNRLENKGKLITCVETSGYRKERLLNKYPSIINYIYYSLDYLAKRVVPKLPVLSSIYFFVTAGRNRVLTSVEVMGRLVYCGFNILETKRIDNLLYISSEKVDSKIKLKPKTYGFFFKMNRTGMNGKPITVYKIRTMHAYAEYLQDYIYSNNSLDKGGKFKNDYRVNLVGKLVRKFWLDELPMLYNLIKGDVKLVGVRPLSNQYLKLYTPKLVARRQGFKPGLVPPYYADLPETIEEIMKSEMDYFDAYEKNAFKTDVRYFFQALNNIIFKKARSK